MQDARDRGLARLGDDRSLSCQQAVADASVDAYRLGTGSAAVLVGLGGALALVGIRDPRRPPGEI